ncbi:DUF3221 domain-containing protein [Bacillus cereus]|uniref:DUF3221 domain-containing protein n=1 Tax=Bacillus cereus TaxID=1396 RepID=A0A9X7CN26_BACCE|nr:DUF3221 domain-containing protein [Bacillus cereus]PGS78531.1 DUF3221 domain-containing protein [Bacillus cereus]
MFTTKQKLVTVATALTLGCGFSFGLTPAFADSNDAFTKVNSTKHEQIRIQIPFTGYIISANDQYLIVADTSTKEEALSYQNNWWELASQNKILKVPTSNTNNYTLGEKINVFSAAWTFSIPPIAINPIIEKVTQ